MLKNQYISLILLLIVVVTIVNLYYKPKLKDKKQTINWLEKIIDPITKFNCPLQGFKCPSNEPCDCEKFCTNANDFVPFEVLDESERIYVMNHKLTPGTYCLPKGIGNCNLNTSYHVFTLAGWSCLGLNDAVFKGDKKRACKNEEAQNNDLNVLYDHLEQKIAGDNIEDYYEPLQDKLRYRCKCESKSLDGTPMISVFPFVCSVDYCLRDISNPLPIMGWKDGKCECGPYSHLDRNDLTSPCRKQISKIEQDALVGRVDCMTEKSFVKHPLVCPTDDGIVFFKEYIVAGTDPTEFVDKIINIP